MIKSAEKKQKNDWKNQKTTPKHVWIDEVICLRSKMCAFKCANCSKNELRGICTSESKNNELEQYKKYLVGSDNQKVCERYIYISFLLL